MRISIVTLLLLNLFVSDICFADEKSDCLSNCANDKRANDMYCPPAGGYTDEENKQCVTKNLTDYTICKNTCSPPAVQQPTETQLPAKQIEE